MSRSNKARHGTNCKLWKDTVQRSRSQARTRSRLKKETKNSPKKTAQSRHPQKPMTLGEVAEWFKKADALLESCPHCGRVMLAGKCCDRMGT